MPISILKAGDYVDMSGRPVSFSVDDLQAIADGYDPERAPAPLCVGHPRHNDPAYGWVASLAVDGDTLVAELDRVDPALRDANRLGRYRRVSASVFPAGHPANPKAGAPYLRHVGFLGGAVPAVGGLPPVNLAGDDDVSVVDACDLAEDALPSGLDDDAAAGPDDVSQPEPPYELAHELADSDARRAMAEKDALIAQMAQRMARLQDENVNFQAENARLLADKYRSEAQAYVDTLVEEARVPPALAASAVDLLVAVGDMPPVDLAGGAALDVPQALRALLGGLPRIIETRELAADPAVAEPLSAEQVATRARALVDEARLRGERLTIPEAVRQISRS